MRRFLRSIPSIVWWISIVSYIIPIVGEYILSEEGTKELLWFLTVLPSFFISYYFGIKGGLIAVSITTAINGGWEVIESFDGELGPREMVTFLEISLIRIVFACGIGILADKLKQNQETIESMAYHDALTGLPNRRLLNERLAEELARVNHNHQILAVMYIDLDGFKFVNDAFSHAIGDLLLQSVAKRLKSCVRKTDTISRQGGDEFIIILPNIRQEDVALHAQNILDVLSRPFILDDCEIYVTSSIGIALHPQYIDGEQNLLKNADMALYRAKEEGKNRYRFFDHSTDGKAVNRIGLEHDLHKALERGELVLYYQPQVNLYSGRIFGMEALIRWNHPKLGMTSPAHFIPLSEETGLIIPIGEWVLHEACRQNKEWQEAGFPPMKIAVNISARQFQQPNLVEIVVQALERTGLDPNYLDLEITESIAMYNEELTLIKLHALKKLGIRISIDDFGTGYSSLSYLKKFPIDTLKIDRSFVTDLSNDSDDAAIVAAVIAMGHSLGLRVLAEGVETEKQLAFLQEHRCNYIQGYYFSKPLSIEDFEQTYGGLKEAAAIVGNGLYEI